MVMLLAPKKTLPEAGRCNKHPATKPEAGAAKGRESLSRRKRPESTAVGSK